MDSSRRLGTVESACRIKEAVADELQRKVWVVCEMRSRNEVECEVGKEGVCVETVEMLSFDEKGMVYEIQDWRRRVKVRRDRAYD